MSDPRRLEQMTREWLELGPTRAPDGPVRAALLAVQTTPQERDFGALLGPSRRWLPLRLAAAAAVVVVALVGVGQLRLLTGDVGVEPSASVTSSPSPAPLDATNWVSFTSDRYGLSLRHPADWVVTPASEFWDFEILRSESHRVDLANDYLRAPSNNPALGVFSMRLPPGTSEEAFLARYFYDAGYGACPAPPGQEWADSIIAGRSVLLVVSCKPQAEAFTFVDGRVYRFELTDRAQYPDGPLFRTILSTVRLNPGDALEAPSPSTTAPSPTSLETATWIDFTSFRHGYAARYPSDYTATPGAAPASLADLGNGIGPSWDRYTSYVLGAADLYGISAKVPDGMSQADWIAAYRGPYVSRLGEACFPPPDAWQPVTVDGHAGGLYVGGVYVGCLYAESTTFVDGRAYIFGLTAAPGFPVDDAAQDFLRAFLSTVTIDAAAADDTPAGG